MNSEPNFPKDGSNSKNEVDNSKGTQQNGLKKEVSTRAKSMLYTKVLPVPKRICNFDQKGPDSIHVLEGEKTMTSFKAANKQELASNSLENLKGFVVGNTTQKMGNEIKQIHKKNVKQAMNFTQTTKNQGQRLLSQTGRLNKQGQPENCDQEEDMLRNINFNMDCEADNLMDPYGQDGIQVQDADWEEQDNELDLLNQLQLLNELD